MPTGYTQQILDGCTFEQFILSVAGQFTGTPLSIDSSGDVLPERSERSDWHAKRLEEAKSNLRLIMDSSDEDLHAEYEIDKENKEELDKKLNANQESIKAKYLAMFAKVEEWIPPTRDHHKLKDFMISQIQESLKFDLVNNTYEKYLIEFDTWKTKKIKRFNRDIVYHLQEYNKEIERIEKTNKWIKQLRESIG